MIGCAAPAACALMALVACAGRPTVVEPTVAQPPGAQPPVTQPPGAEAQGLARVAEPRVLDVVTFNVARKHTGE